MESLRRAVLSGGNPLLLSALRDRLTASSRLVVVAVATTPAETVSALATHRPRFLILQPERFANHGLVLVRSVRKRFPGVKLIIVTQRAEVDALLLHACLGVAAYLLDDDLASLDDYLGAVDVGQVVLAPRLANNLAKLLVTPLGQEAVRCALRQSSVVPSGDQTPASNPPRAVDVVRLVGQGLTNKEVARRLGLRESTVEEHLKRFRAAAGPMSRAALGRYLGRLEALLAPESLLDVPDFGDIQTSTRPRNTGLQLLHQA